MENKKNNINPLQFIIFLLFIIFIINPFLGIIVVVFIVQVYLKNDKFKKFIEQKFKDVSAIRAAILKQEPDKKQENEISTNIQIPLQTLTDIFTIKKNINLQKNKKYLQIALNSTLEDAQNIIRQLPVSEKIIIEAGTPLIKIYGMEAVRKIRSWSPSSYIVADIKTSDMGEKEVELAYQAGANGVTCLGVAPVETIDDFIATCRKFKIDSMIDMMNMQSPLTILKKLKKLPDVVILHRGVDETELSKEKMIPFYQIKQIKGAYSLKVAIAGGDNIKEVQSAIFNDADIVVVWKSFMQSNDDIGKMAQNFLKEIK